MPKRIFITAAEASGDQHAAELVRSLKSLDPTIEIQALGGPKMKAAGANVIEDTVERAAMGWRGALRFFEARRWMKRVARHYREQKPDLHICVDSSAINIPFARQAKSFGIPTLYYVAPQLWASREGRIKQMRQYVDHVACIFPFEQEYFRSRGVPATFVGHPLFDQLPADRSRPPGPHFPDAAPVIGIVPGSRLSEVKANLPHLIEVMGRILAAFPETRFVIPTTSAADLLVSQMIFRDAVTRRVFSGMGRVWIPNMPPRAREVRIIKDSFDQLVPRCDLVITKSGTSTVHVAAWNVPMIVVYRINPILWHGAARWLIKTKKIAMVNILAGQIDLVPEFIPWHGPNQPVADCAIDLLKHPEKLADQRQKLAKLMKQLDQPGASMNAAKIAMQLIEGQKSCLHMEAKVHE